MTQPSNAHHPDDVSDDVLDALAQRGKSFAASHNPLHLWPSVDPDSIQTAATAIGSAVTCVLAGAPANLRAHGVDAEAFSIAALLTGVGPLLGYWHECGELDVDDVVSDIRA